MNTKSNSRKTSQLRKTLRGKNYNANKKVYGKNYTFNEEVYPIICEVKNVYDKNYTFEMTSNDTILDVKKKLRHVSNILPHSQVLCYIDKINNQDFLKKFVSFIDANEIKNVILYFLKREVYYSPKPRENITIYIMNVKDHREEPTVVMAYNTDRINTLKPKIEKATCYPAIDQDLAIGIPNNIMQNDNLNLNSSKYKKYILRDRHGLYAYIWIYGRCII